LPGLKPLLERLGSDFSQFAGLNQSFQLTEELIVKLQAFSFAFIMEGTKGYTM
jgi:hypothetical protein